ncbi:MAG: tetratricopeptide repeat protein, partial [Brevinema sp.]
LNYNLGWLEYRNANYPDALNLWSDIYKNEPSNPILSYALGSTFYQMNNPRLAQMEFQKSANSYARITDLVNEPSLNNPRHVEVFSQTARVRNNLGVINANYARANPAQRIRYEKDALLNFYAAKDAADRIRQIYNNAEYNILVITHPNIEGRPAEFDNTVPKSTTINNKDLEFKRLVLEQI